MKTNCIIICSVLLLACLTHCHCFLQIARNTAEASESCQPRSHNVSNPHPEDDPRAPDNFLVTWYTTVSPRPLVLNVTRAWSPRGVDRFYQLVMDNYFDCAAFFRVVPDFVVQFGIAAEPDETAKWGTEIQDDPVVQSNTYGTVSFATSGADTRTTQVFINLADNSRLDEMGFSAFGTVVLGMEDVMLKIYNPTPGNSGGADQGLYKESGNDWILETYPEIDLILTADTEDTETDLDLFSSSSSSASVVVVAFTTGLIVAVTVVIGGFDV